MYKVTKQIHFCYGHRLLRYQGKCRHLHGHNGKVEIELAAGELDDRGMVVDFDDIKRVLQTWIDEHLDHRMLLQRKDPLRGALEKAGEPLFLMDTNPTAESIARLIFDVAREHDLPVTAVTLWETPHSFAAYRGPEKEWRKVR